MEINYYNQPKDGNFCEILSNVLKSKKYNRAYFYAGFVKDNAIELLFDSIKEASNNGMNLYFVFGIDKKNTSKEMLSKLLSVGANIRYFINDDEGKLETRLYLFESDDGTELSFVPGSKLSEGGITSNLTLIQEIKYFKEDKMQYSKLKAAVESGIQEDKFINLNEAELKDLASRGEIVARITERRIPTINELYSLKDETNIGVIDYDEGSSTDYSELVNKNIDILIDDEKDVKYQTSLGEEVEHKLKKDKSSEEIVKSKIVLPDKNIDISNASTLIYFLAKKSNSGETSKEIKIASAIASGLPNIFDYPNNYHVERDEKGNIKEAKAIHLTIFDNSSKSVVTDEKASIVFSSKQTAIKSELLSDVVINEEDILRFVKESNDTYRCEIIRKDSAEYDVWKPFCTRQIKGTTKKFGVI